MIMPFTFRKTTFSVLLYFFIQIGCYSQADSTSIKKIEAIIAKSNKLYYLKTDSALILAETALKQSEEVGYDKGVADALTTIGIAYDIYGDLGKSILTHKRAFDIYNRIEDLEGKANCQYNIALILAQDGKYEEAISYSTESSKYYRESGNRQYEANTLTHIGELMNKKGENISLVIGKLEEARSIYKEFENMLGISSTLNLQGDAYLTNQKNQKAVDCYTEAVDILINLNNPWYLGYSYLGLAKSYLNSDDLQLASINAQRSIDQYRLIKHKRRINELYQIQSIIAEERGDLQSALDNFRIHQLYKDSLYNDNQSKQINLLKTQFETEKKEAEIASLSQQASIQALEIRQKNQTIIIGVVVILFILGALYFFYKQRETKKQQSQTELEQRFLRSQLNPHFISNALVAVQSFMLKNDSESAALYLTKFSKLMREILENSRKEFIPVEEEISMLRNYLDIHKLRLGTFDFSIEIDENIDPETDTIPPMFVQPFVENAVEHGIAHVQSGKINLRFKKEGDYISIAVDDNGKGLQDNNSIDHTSLSTTIIQERMALFNRSLKKKIQLVVDNLQGENGEVNGTQVELKVPFG